MEDLIEQPLDALDVRALQAFAHQVYAAKNRLTGKLDQVLAELEIRSGGKVEEHPDGDGPPLWQPVRTWWRDQATISGGAAGRDLRRCLILRDLPLLAAAVTDGRLTPEQAEVLCRLEGKIPAADLAASQADLITLAAALNPEDLAQWVRHQIATYCEPALEREAESAEADRYLQLNRQPGGRVTGRFSMPAADAESLFTVLEPLARREGLKDERSRGQRNVDALRDVFDAAVRWMDLPDAGGQRPNVSYIVPAGWAAGHEPQPFHLHLVSQSPAGQTHQSPTETGCASGLWSGPVTRTRVETILCDARISRVLLDGLGQVTGLESLTGEITPAQRRALAARDRHCVAYGCSRPPAFCDAHHLIHREDGGATTLSNLVLLCRRHHVRWHQGRLQLHELYVPWLQPAYPEPLLA